MVHHPVNTALSTRFIAIERERERLGPFIAKYGPMDYSYIPGQPSCKYSIVIGPFIAIGP
jgi:hypothetical protein